MGKWAEIIASAPLGDPAKQRFISKMEKSRGKIFDAYFKFRDQYECEFPDTWVEEEEDDPDRYDRDDPCKGKKLLFDNLTVALQAGIFLPKRSKIEFCGKKHSGISKTPLRTHHKISFCYKM